MDDLGFVLFIVMLLVLLNGLFVAAEFAIIATSRTAMASRASSGDRAAATVARILGDPVRLDRYVATAQLGITFASLGLGMYGEHQLSMYIEGWLRALGFEGVGAWISAHAIAVVLAIGAMTYLHIVLGEMIPKSLAISHSAATALWVLRPMQLISLLLFPLVLVLNWVGLRLLSLVGFRRARGAVHSPLELQRVARQSQAEGLLGKETARVFNELVDFGALTAAQAMVPRVLVTGLRQGASFEDVARLISEHPHTRYPVYEIDLDHIIGTAHIRDLLDVLRERRALVREDIRETAYLPETATLDEVLAAMQRVRNQMVVVMDEHGGTAGTVTMEDLYAEVVGEVEEGTEDVPDIVSLSGGRKRVFGTVRLDILGEALGKKIAHDEVESVSGLVLAELGRPPRVGDSVLWNGLRFDVMRLHGRGVAEAIVQVWPAPSDGD